MDRDGVDDIKREFRQQVGVLTEAFQSRISAVIEGQESLRRGLDAKIEWVGSDMTDVKARLTRVETGQG